MGILVELSIGELIDRMTILELKSAELAPGPRRAARRELRVLRSAIERQVPDVGGLQELTDELRKVNRSLWDVEEALRQFENARTFGAAFVKAARSVYQLNDQRAAIKRAIDRLLGSPREELKSFELPAIH